MLETFPLDIAVFNAIHGLAGIAPLSDALGIFLASYLPYILVLAVLVFVFQRPTAKEKMGTFLTLLLAVLVSRFILADIVQFLYPIARPFVTLGFTPLISASGASFPSGHASFFFALSFALFIFDRRWGYWFLTLSFLIGLARIFVGVHYPTDILGGIIVGLISYFIVKKLIRPERFCADSAPVAPIEPIGEATTPSENA